MFDAAEEQDLCYTSSSEVFRDKNQESSESSLKRQRTEEPEEEEQSAPPPSPMKEGDRIPSEHRLSLNCGSQDLV